MKVLCNKNTKRLVKGAIYDVILLRNSKPTGAGYWKPYIKIKIGSEEYSFSINGFLNVDGTPIEEKNWESSEYKNHVQIVIDTAINSIDGLKGNYVICRIGSKMLDKGKIYKVSDAFQKEETRPGYNNNTYKYITKKIKIEGYNRWLNPYNFRKLTTQETRNISLGSLFDEKTKVENVSNDRKLDRLDKKKKQEVILSCLFQSMLDGSKNNLSTIEWTVTKKGKLFGITEDDIKPFLNKKMSDIIKIFDEK